MWVYVAVPLKRMPSSGSSGSSSHSRRKMVSSLLLLHVLCGAASALYFHIGETEKKCFIEEIPDETMIIGEWRGVFLCDSREVFRGQC